MTQISFSFSLFPKMYFWLLSFVLSFWIIFLFFYFIPIKDKVPLTQNLSPLVSVCSPHPLYNPSSEEKEALSVGFLIRNKRLLLAGSLVKISLLSTPFPGEQQWMQISPAHPTLFKLSFALSVKSWHSEDSRTWFEFNPGELPINITWLFLPISCSLSVPDVEWCLSYSLSWPLLSWPS